MADEGYWIHASLLIQTRESASDSAWVRHSTSTQCQRGTDCHCDQAGRRTRKRRCTDNLPHKYATYRSNVSVESSQHTM